MHKDVVSQLIIHGHDKDKLKNMSLEELQELFEQESKKKISSFSTILQEQGFVETEQDVLEGKAQTPFNSYWEKILSSKDEAMKIYDIIGNMIHDYSCEEILDFFANMASGSFFRSLEGMLEVKWSEYQEILLDEIEEHYKELPQDELKTQMEYYESIRDQVPRLEFILKNLKKNSKHLIYMAHLKKKIIEDFFVEQEKNDEWK